MDLEVYLNSKLLSWSPTTISSSRSRLKKALPLLQSVNNDCYKFYEELCKQGYNKYSIKQIFLQLSGFLEFFGDSSFKIFIKRNALVFKNAYEIEKIDFTFSEALERINSMENEEAKQIALAIIQSGLRAHEALKYDGSGYVIGKGSRKRAVFFDKALYGFHLKYKTLYIELKKVGLKPHTLRKLAATRLAEKGFKEADLMAVMGWKSIQTASSYLQSTREVELKNKVMEALK